MKNRKKDRINTGKFACLSMLLCLAVIMGYLEALIPVSFMVPGIKLGFANYVIVIVLYLFRARAAYIVSCLRVIIIGLLFTNLSMMLYSLAGTLCAVSLMAVLKKSGKFSMMGVSSAGGIIHNMAQLFIAYLIIPSQAFIVYVPWLLLAGTAAGLAIGFLVKISFPAIQSCYIKYFRTHMEDKVSL